MAVMPENTILFDFLSFTTKNDDLSAWFSRCTFSRYAWRSVLQIVSTFTVSIHGSPLLSYTRLIIKVERLAAQACHERPLRAGRHLNPNAVMEIFRMENRRRVARNFPLAESPPGGAVPPRTK